jgi:hypothetical protein
MPTGLTDEEMFGSGAPQTGMTDEEMFGADPAQQEPARVPYTELESAARAARSGALFDLYDEGAGAVKAGLDVLSGDTDMKGVYDAYKKYRDEERMKDKLARQDNPKSYLSGQIAGGLGTAFIPGLGWLNVGKGATLAGAAAKGAAGAGLGGFGASEGETGREILEDTLDAAKLGAVTGGALRGAGKLATGIKPSTVAKKGANIMLNTPEELTELAIRRGRPAIEKAPIRADVAKRYQGILDDLKKATIEGSKEAREQLAGTSFKAADVGKKFGGVAGKTTARMGKIADDPEKLAGVKRLEELEKMYKEAGGRVTGSRVKDTIQALDKQVDFDIGSGKFAKADQRMLKDARRQIDQMLKKASPAYAEDMKRVAADTQLLDKASKLGSDKTLANVMRRVVNDEFGAGVFPREIIQQVDARMGSDILDQAHMALAREAFDKSITQGSMNVNKFSNWLQDVPVLKYAAPLIGASVDKYGRKMTLGAIDAAHYLERVGDKFGYDRMMEAAQPFIDLANKGNKPAALGIMMIDEKYKREGLDDAR